MKLVQKNSRTALTLVDVLIVIVAVAILAALLLPAVHTTNKRPTRLMCVNNLKQVGLAFRLWSQDHADKYPMLDSVTNGGVMELAADGKLPAVFQVMSNELNTPKILVCPADSQRSEASNFTSDFNDDKISYFVNLDASDINPQMFLSGDRNLTINAVPVTRGNVMLATNQAVGWTQDIHHGFGNIAFTDGSVQPLNDRGLNAALPDSGVATNRLIIP